MTSILASYPPTRLLAAGDSFGHHLHKVTDCSRILCFVCSNSDNLIRSRVVRRRPFDDSRWVVLSAKFDRVRGDDDSEDDFVESGSGPVNSDMIREKLEKIVGTDDSSFSGLDLATLIRNKYGRSYDVQLIKKEFMGRNLLAMNVMWKYMEQRSFPLTEEEYILRLDDVANALKCWGAVSHVRSTLEKSKERPRIGKVSSWLLILNLTLLLLNNRNKFLNAQYVFKTLTLELSEKAKKFRNKAISPPLEEQWDHLFGDTVAIGLGCVAPSAIHEFLNNKEPYSSRLEGLEQEENGSWYDFVAIVNGNDPDHPPIHANTAPNIVLKAVSIFIDMDESGGRAKEWIYNRMSLIQSGVLFLEALTKHHGTPAAIWYIFTKQAAELSCILDSKTETSFERMVCDLQWHLYRTSILS
ncbi:hypothetical protein STAS_33844 [Striga asiatica]|uniref:Uncharacterized protein n=1 Tax=Striga asiatica TaxID=4170 RepID=A0A5A7RG03_STRAF|nr:hypothetical protein STAS_33844 [Striga asiatica]